MPFEERGTTARRIAVIGAGISGMGAAYHLAEENHVVLFEAETRLGGHARTKMAGKRGDQPVDTGFIVFNYQTYPHLIDLFEKLEVPIAPSKALNSLLPTASYPQVIVPGRLKSLLVV